MTGWSWWDGYGRFLPYYLLRYRRIWIVGLRKPRENSGIISDLQVGIPSREPGLRSSRHFRMKKVVIVLPQNSTVIRSLCDWDTASWTVLSDRIRKMLRKNCLNKYLALWSYWIGQTCFVKKNIHMKTGNHDCGVICMCNNRSLWRKENNELVCILYEQRFLLKFSHNGGT